VGLGFSKFTGGSVDFFCRPLGPRRFPAAGRGQLPTAHCPDRAEGPAGAHHVRGVFGAERRACATWWPRPLAAGGQLRMAEALCGALEVEVLGCLL
jgi:hypothetical protein